MIYYEYIKSYHQNEDNINLCTEHAVAINEIHSLIARNPEVEEVQNCIVCSNEIELQDLILSLE